MDQMPHSLTAVLIIFLVGFLLHRHASVRIAAVACLVLGALLANGLVGDLVHNLAEMYQTITT